MNNKFAVIGCLEETILTLNHMLRAGIKPQVIVGLSSKEAERFEITNYVDLRPFCLKNKIEFAEVKNYSLSSVGDKKLLADLKIAVLAVIGWQRLLPQEVIAGLGNCALGFHGSCNVLPWGRGRSPINWSIIEGRTRFLLHMFYITPGVDDGSIIGIQPYDINDSDNCRTVYYKTALSQAELVIRYLPSVLAGTNVGSPQVGEAFYYQKRRPDDGRIDWSKPAGDICRLVRAVTKPYPGAFTMRENDKLVIWAAQPFSKDFFEKEIPGAICFVSENAQKEVIVKCGDGSVLLTDYDGMFSTGDILI